MIEFSNTKSERGAVTIIRNGDASFTRFCSTVLLDDVDVGPQVKFCETSISALQTFIESKGGEYSSEGLQKAVNPFIAEIGNGIDGLIGRALIKKSVYDQETKKKQTPVIDATNNADAIKRMNIREWFNSLNVPAKAEAIMAGDIDVLVAILEVGPVVSGLDKDMYSLAVKQHETLTWAGIYFQQVTEKAPVSTYGDLLPKVATIASFIKEGEAAYLGHHKQMDVVNAVDDYLRGIIDMVAIIIRADGQVTFDRLLNG